LFLHLFSFCFFFLLFFSWKSEAKAIKGRLENFRTVFTVKVVLFNIVFREPGWGGEGNGNGNTDNLVFSLKYELEVGERVDGAQRGQYKFWKSDLEMCVLYIVVGGGALFIVQGLK
jgi:hypothetical protein